MKTNHNRQCNVAKSTVTTPLRSLEFSAGLASIIAEQPGVMSRPVDAFNFALKTGEPEACESKHARTPVKEYATIDTVFLWGEGLGS